MGSDQSVPVETRQHGNYQGNRTRQDAAQRQRRQQQHGNINPKKRAQITASKESKKQSMIEQRLVQKNFARI